MKKKREPFEMPHKSLQMWLFQKGNSDILLYTSRLCASISYYCKDASMISLDPIRLSLPIEILYISQARSSVCSKRQMVLHRIYCYFMYIVQRDGVFLCDL